MLERFLEQQAAVCASLLDQKMRKGASDVNTLNESDISAAEDLVGVLSPVKVATTIMCEEKQPTLSMITPLKAKLLDHLKISEEDSTLIKEIKRTMAGDLRDRYLDVQQILDKASALDPRFKKLPYTSVEDEEKTFECIITEAAALWDQTVSLHYHVLVMYQRDILGDILHHPEYGPVSKKRKALAKLFGDTFCTVDPNQTEKSSRQIAQAEMVKYKDTDSLTLDGNALDWWRCHQSEFPLIANLAKKYLCIPGTSVSSERVFSTAGDIVHSDRSVLSAQHVDQLFAGAKLAQVNGND
ncbi:Zinc finger BED domain-containing protein 1 [Merluccius polli]|uniref:Zinc finger BED domain-containing protein 1 n=1 Tax=Merluccius polli TaxID=89951 RepID=A0AA47P053_MERPO|nr:Zinc finger BED domain-containing protein 1 [Merluccius polli]